ncbi:MAG: DNA polymerase III subunit beta [Clostridia bacterium]|nr:DNA polymerase III subunit beta [Clostridia bacterium]
MRIRAEKKAILDAVAPCLGTVATRSASEMLSCLHLKCDEENKKVVITSFDYTKGARSGFDAEIQEGGTLLVDAVKFNAMCRALPGDTVTVEADVNFNVTLSAGGARFDISGLNGDLFPAMPVLEGEKSFHMPRGLFRKMLQQVVFACATVDVKPILTGILFEVDEEKITMVGCDGFRLALRREKGIKGLPIESRFVMPARSAQELIKLLPDDDEDIRIDLGFRHVIIFFENFTFFTRYVDGEYIEYQKSFPKETKTHVSVPMEAALGCFERCALLIDDRAKSPIRFEVTEAGLHVVCRTANGKIDEVIPCQVEGDGMIVGFNNRYLLDAIHGAAGAGAGELLMELNSPLASMIIRSPEREDFLYVVVPMRLT